MHLDLLIGVQVELATFGYKFDAEVKRLGERIKPGRMSRTKFCDTLDSLIALLQEAGQIAERNTLRLSAIAASPESAPEAIASLVRLAVARQSLAAWIKATAERVLKAGDTGEPETYHRGPIGNGLTRKHRWRPEEPDVGCCSNMGTVDLTEKGKS